MQDMDLISLVDFMRVSACGFAAKSLEEAQELAVKVTEVSHNHPESIKAAKAVAYFLSKVHSLGNYKIHQTP